MADDKLAEPKSGNAFQDGFLNNEVASAVIKKLNRTMKVKLKGATDGKVLQTKENVVIDLTPMLGEGVEVYLIKNGELRKARIPIVWLS